MESSGTQAPRDVLTGAVIGCAIEVHAHLGPGLLESAYRECLCKELTLNKIGFEREISLPLNYKGLSLACGYRMDLVVEGRLVVELKAVDQILPIHKAQLLSYLKLSGIRTGLLLNFHSPLMKQGIVRLVL